MQTIEKIRRMPRERIDATRTKRARQRSLERRAERATVTISRDGRGRVRFAR